MYWCDGVHRLELDEDGVIDEKIEARFADDARLVWNTNTDLSFEGNRPIGQLQTQGLLVDGLEEAGAEHAMHFDGGSDHLGGTPVSLLAWFNQDPF